MLSLFQAANWIDSKVLISTSGNLQTSALRVHTDTRSLQPGDLFVALKGDSFDGNAFVAEAASKGCTGVIAERGVASCGLPGIEVSDARLALGQLSAGWRSQFNLPLIAVAGSNGKTTVTQMVAAILRAWHGEMHTLATQGNFNNDVGLPLTLLRLRSDHLAAVVEIGMNHPGEIAQLAPFAAPTVALVNNAQREHQEFMATVEAVACENGAVISALAADGVAVFPVDDEFTPLWRRLAGKRRVLSFGLCADADVNAKSTEHGLTQQLQCQTPQGNCEITLSIPGLHNAKNAMAAAACALAAGAPLAAIKLGLESFSPVKGRLVAQTVSLNEQSFLLLDDTYNANPDSMRAAIDVLARLPSPRWLVAGDMGEVGSEGPRFHADIGAYAKHCGIDKLFGLGEQCLHAIEAFGQGGLYNLDRNTFAHTILAELLESPPASVLIKGSRFMKMEEFVALLANPSTAVGGAHVS